MSQIYVFQDASGHWHGDFDVTPLDGEPEQGTFTYLPVPGTPEAASPFAGQTLKVLHAATGLEPGPVIYQLDDGGHFQPTWHVYTLLAAPIGSQPTPGTPAHATTQEPYVDIALTDNGRRYLMTATRSEGDAMNISLTTCALDGHVQGDLNGTIPRTDLPGLVRILQAAITTPSTPANMAPTQTDTPPPALKSGAPWTPEERARLVERYRQEQDFHSLGHEFGRSALSIQHQLAHLGLAKRPSPPHPSTPTAPKQRTGPTHDELRATHPRSHKPWTDQEEQQLALRCEQGATAEEMSAEFERTVGAIESRLRLTRAHGPAADKARQEYL
ncbi:hypothetical protein ACWCYZ_33555 [Streptomyces virginiae]